MLIESAYSLAEHNSFGFDICAAFFARAGSEDDLREALAWCSDNSQPLCALGGGSNTVFAGQPPGLTVHIGIKGIEHEAHPDGSVVLRVGAGEDWHALVTHCLEQGWHGLENLALIPGAVGSAPIQNIGAYGVELSDRFVQLEAIDREDGGAVTLDAEACAFGYRDSAFKQHWRERFLISRVWLKLNTTAQPVLDYPAIRKALQDTVSPTPEDVFNTVVAVRRARIPDPREIGNAGSFFTNPLVQGETRARLLADHPDLPNWPQADGQYKLSAGWLIEQCGWKGFRDGAVGVHEHQALVLLNLGGATGLDVLALAERIADSVRVTFGIDLTIEPTVVRP
ncbi:MAG: UDP-N-acetylmuramate dehydrogenase [Pseudomonadota bacterium]